MDDFKKVPESVEELETILEEVRRRPSNENEVATEGGFDDEDSTDESETEEVRRNWRSEETESWRSDDESKNIRRWCKVSLLRKNQKQIMLLKLRQRLGMKKTSSYENFINEMDTMARCMATRF